MNFNRPQRQYGPLVIPILAGVAGLGVGAAVSAMGAKGAKTDQVPGNPTPTAAQTVDPSTAKGASDPAALGRAALISTSSQGVLGTDPVGRRKLFGNTGFGGTSS